MTEPRDLFFYRAYGLVIRSDHPIDALTPCAAKAADVVVERGPFDREVEGLRFTSSFANWHAAENLLILEIADTARYMVRDGTEIRIDPAPLANTEDINAFLLGSAFSALLQQRRFLTLHSSAVNTARGAVLFVGRSGVGKSTTLAALVDHSFEMVTDDIAAVSFDDSCDPQITPSYPSTRLRQDALITLGKPVDHFPRLRSKVDKFVVPIARFDCRPKAVDRVILLDIHEKDQIDFDLLNPADAFGWLAHFTFRKRFYDGMGLSGFHFEALSNFVKSTPVQRLRRPDYPNRLDDLIARIVQELGHEVARPRKPRDD